MDAECLGVTYNAEPVTDDQESTLALELHVVTFESSYYKTQQGKNLYLGFWGRVPTIYYFLYTRDSRKEKD